MRDFEQHNRREIDRLNQRGGRMLSLVDLLAAGTVSLDLAAEMAATAAAGGSVLTAAGPGGVGKTTLMGAVLAFLPPGTGIVAIEGPHTLHDLPAPAPDAPRCLVVHEIGNGPYYGYLWGPAVGRYFDAACLAGRCLASNLHAETYEGAATQLAGLGVSAEAFAAVDVVALMIRRGGLRRVTAAWYADGHGGHRCAWRWSVGNDQFERVGPGPGAAGEEEVARHRAFLEAALQAGGCRLEAVRERALRELCGAG